MENKKQEEMLNAMENNMQRFFHKESENKMTPKQALEEIGKLEVYFDGIVVEINGCTKTREKYDLINKALTEHEKQTQILEVLKNKQVNFLELKEDIINCDNEKRALELYNERHRYDEEYNDTQLTKIEFNLIKEWLK